MNEWNALRRRSRKWNLTPTAVILTAYAKVLERWNDRPDLTLNLTALNRPGLHPEIGNIMGDFTQNVLVETDFTRSRSFREEAQTTLKTLFDNLEYQDSYDPAQLWSVLAPMPEITDLLIDDAARWRDDFIADGLNPDRVTVAMHAAKSFVHEAQLDPGISTESIARAKSVILALTNETGPLVDVSDTESSFDDVEEAVVEELESATGDKDSDKEPGDDSKDSSV